MQEISTVFFLGRPGSGKGTQAKLLSQKTGWSIFSSGNAFKALREEPGLLGQKVKSDYDQGKLLPDWLVNYLFVKAVMESGGGFICEGFPRRLSQAQLAEEVCAWLGKPYRVIMLEASEEETMRRQLSRAKVENRPDSDDADKIKARFAIYQTETEPIVKYFEDKGLLVKINGEQPIEAITRDIASALALT